MAYEEFAAFAERFAREHGEPGTLSTRHLQRLAAGGKSSGEVRPVTARLLERIFGLTIEELLTQPRGDASEPDGELSQRLQASRFVDSEIVALLGDQLPALRRLDRQLGAVVAHGEVLAKARQVEHLFKHSLASGIRVQLAALLAQLSTLAGWQALDLGKTAESWDHYERAKAAARDSGSKALEVHAMAEQAFVLVDVGETASAVDQLAGVRRAAGGCSPVMRSWLAAAHGEVLAADGHRDGVQRAFDEALSSLPIDDHDEAGPYLVLDPTHLARWRGHALARFGDVAAVGLLSAALEEMRPEFVRAEVGLRVDLAFAAQATGRLDLVGEHVRRAEGLARSIGSTRQLTRLRVLAEQRDS